MRRVVDMMAEPRDSVAMRLIRRRPAQDELVDDNSIAIGRDGPAGVVWTDVVDRQNEVGIPRSRQYRQIEARCRFTPEGLNLSKRHAPHLRADNRAVQLS